MKVLDVYIEHATPGLDRPFSYAYFGDRLIARGFRVLVPFGLQKVIGFVSQVHETTKTIESYQAETGVELKAIYDILDEERLLNDELWQLCEWMSAEYFTPLIRVFQTILPPSIKPKSSALRAPKIAYDAFVELVDDEEEGLSDKQKEWLRLVAKERRIRKKDFTSKTILDKLCQLDKVKIVYEERRRLQLPEETIRAPLQLSEDQMQVIKAFQSSKQEVALLEGVTGSGKTEVYLRLSQQYMDEGRSVLFLVPEIALTPMMIDYFSHRFPGQTAILHSELTPGERYDEYRRIARGDARFVIGARSAIFAPLQNIGLIILDEEHVESYMQDTMPCYHAREIAKWRAQYYHGRLLLGSATPSLESKARAMKGVYQFLAMPHRIHEAVLPRTEIVNLLDSRNLDRESALFSLSLRSALRETLARGEQAVLLLNRRGYSPYVSCRECGHIFKCPECDITLTYHREDHMLKCHHCDHVEVMPTRCPNCQSSYLSKQGFGTERIVEEIRRLFPPARVLRLDSDVARLRQRGERILETFRRHEADILVGTQMIAKGHDFPEVTLVGIVLADVGLSLPSFRSSERTFQLITQAVGRAGRGHKQGRAIIQTYMPTHYAILAGAAQDYPRFFAQEMRVRKLQMYPPYTYLVAVRISAKNEEKAVMVAQEIITQFHDHLADQVTVLGPSLPFYRRNDQWHARHLLVKYRKGEVIKPFLHTLFHEYESRNDLRLQIIMDPYDV